jgi:beta-mannosidase
MNKLYLNDNWMLHGEKIGTLKATVPGCVHTDLINHGIIKDIYWRDNNNSYQWIENENFTYTCTFDAEESDFATMVFEGLDTYCEIYLNGEHLGGTHNMFIPHEFFVGGKLRSCGNELRVEFRSPVKEVEGLPLLPAAFTKERLHTRRMQCTYGWDWVDRFVTCGIHRPVYIKYGNDMQVESAYIVTENIDKYSAQIRVELELSHYENGGLVNIEIISPNGEIIINEKVYSKEPKLVRRYDVENAELWYPLGYGKHPLYSIRATVGENEFTESFGIRTVKILQLRDKENSEYEKICLEMRNDEIGQIRDKNEHGRGFQIIINGEKILTMGGNWVPCDPFPSEETPKKLEMLVSRAAEMGVNMLRIWGGGHFGFREFYDICDRFGIMTTFDFLMACGGYPEEEDWFIEELKKEAEFAVKLVRNHPCFMWYSGDNENGTCGSDVLENYRGRKAAYTASAPIVYKLDPHRQFLPSSPYGGDVYMSRTVGTMHNTTYLGYQFNYFNETDCSNYKEFLERFKGRFIAEEPVFTMANKSTLLKMMTEEDIADRDEVMLEHHTRNNPALPVPIYRSMTNFAKKIMGEQENPDVRLFEYKYIGYEWTRVVMENMRRHIGFCNGMVFWMYNDCWPASMSWSFVDYYGMPKASFYAFRRLSRPYTSSVTSENGEYKITLSNLTNNSVSGTVRATFMKKSDNFAVVAEKELALSVDAYSASSLPLDYALDPDIVVVCDAHFGEYTDRCFYAYDRLFIKDCAENIEVVDFGFDSITIKANSYVHAVELEGECIFSDNYFSLMAGEQKTVTWKQLGENDDFGIYAYTLK